MLRRIARSALKSLVPDLVKYLNLQRYGLKWSLVSYSQTSGTRCGARLDPEKHGMGVGSYHTTVSACGHHPISRVYVRLPTCKLLSLSGFLSISNRNSIVPYFG